MAHVCSIARVTPGRCAAAAQASAPPMETPCTTIRVVFTPCRHSQKSTAYHAHPIMQVFSGDVGNAPHERRNNWTSQKLPRSARLHCLRNLPW